MGLAGLVPAVEEGASSTKSLQSHSESCSCTQSLGQDGHSFTPSASISPVLALRTGGWSSTGTKVMGNRNTWCLRPQIRHSEYEVVT